MERIKLGEDEKKLLEISASDLIPMMSQNKELGHVRQNAFEYYDKGLKEVFQVQVTVTRRKPDFLDVFQTEEMTELAGSK